MFLGDGKRIIQYLGTDVSRTAISGARIVDLAESTLTFAWKDRTHSNAKRSETISSIDFVTVRVYDL